MSKTKFPKEHRKNQENHPKLVTIPQETVDFSIECIEAVMGNFKIKELDKRCEHHLDELEKARNGLQSSDGYVLVNTRDYIIIPKGTASDILL